MDPNFYSISTQPRIKHAKILHIQSPNKIALSLDLSTLQENMLSYSVVVVHTVLETEITGQTRGKCFNDEALKVIFFNETQVASTFEDILYL